MNLHGYLWLNKKNLGLNGLSVFYIYQQLAKLITVSDY
nr:MAG TPA: hypothetical protein [Caudoviricetes sp.]